MSLCPSSLQQGATIWEAMKWAENCLNGSGRPDAHVDAKLLMLYVLDCNDTMLLLDRQKVMNEEALETYKNYVAIRQTGVPLQHITGVQEFMGLEFKVNENVLIPRQDTETLIEQLLEKLNQKVVLAEEKNLMGIDIGTGSGCIGISLAHYISQLKMTLVDISKQALEVAAYNIKAHHLESRIETLESNLLEQYQGEKVDFIVSNPPYIAKKDMEDLMIEVKEYEPHLALTDQGDGLYFYREISRLAKNYLKQDGLVAYEIGYDQGEAVKDILAKEGYREIELYQDLAGQDRVVIARVNSK
ncbi:MAG: peptide chain release factor N(5)-glutamine methyltransferase [Cellulosilyticum sp.]|nr:peptide chain release factor N(5)-glutamine methyltransferase [Cellulosilyticum sp.]